MTDSPANAVAALLAIALLATPPAAAGAAAAELKLDVQVKIPSGKDVPVCAAVALPQALAGTPPEAVGVTMISPSGKKLPGQIVRNDEQTELWWVPDETQVGTARWTAVLSDKPYPGKDVFAFRDEKGKYLDVTFAGRRVTRYMYEFDRSTRAEASQTYKTYHHVFDAAGKAVITKGAGGHDTHHRGIYIGWGRTVCNGRRYDFWGMGGGAAQVHQKFLHRTAGPVLARATALIHWQDKDGKAIVAERRTTTCFRQPAPAILLMDFYTTLTAVAGDVSLGGSPEHAGFQYRPHNQVAINVGATGGRQTADKAPEELKTRYEFHKEGIKTSSQRLKDNRDLPWAAESYALRGKRYSVQHMNHNSNPKGTVYSAYRQYGRFGACFKATIKAGQTLPLRYRLYVAERTMPPRAEMNLRHAAFVSPPIVRAAK